MAQQEVASQEPQAGNGEEGIGNSESRKGSNSQANAKKMVSLRKVEANRRNALRSTGPRRPEGKSGARWNALKHGLLAREIVIPAQEGRENAAELLNLLAQLRDDLHPEGVLEEVLIEKIAVCYWRLRRVLRCEMGEIRKRLDNVTAAKEVAWRDVLKRLPEGENVSQVEAERWIEPERARCNLPESKVVDKILRYETAIERQLYRALHQLERIQRQKGGEAVPPPLSVEFLGER